MYQWKETKTERTQDNVGDSATTITTYDYSREWSADAVDSSKFKHPDGHQNPAMPFRSKRFAASDAKLGWRLAPMCSGNRLCAEADARRAARVDAARGELLS